MIIRALLVGTLLAGLSGAAVFYGLGETDGDVETRNLRPNIPNIFVPKSARGGSAADANDDAASLTPNKNEDEDEDEGISTQFDDVSDDSEDANERLNAILDEIEKDITRVETPPESKLEASDLDKENLTVTYGSGGESRSEITASEVMLPDSATESAETLPGEALPNEAVVAPPKTESTCEKVKALMTPRASGRFIVEDDTQKDVAAKDIITPPVTDNSLAELQGETIVPLTPEVVPNIIPADVIQDENASMVEAAPIETAPIETAKPDLDVAEIESMNARLRKARRISNKTARDKIYLEIFDNAIDSGNVDMAARVGEKLSSPQLRQLTRDIIANSAK